MQKNKFNFTFVVILSLFLIDIYLKYFIDQGFFSKLNFINYVHNQGVVFGLYIPPQFLIVLSAIIILLLIVVFFSYLKEELFYFSLSILFIIFGALSNFIDRVALGYVVDYIDLPFWPVFNLADVMIVAGVVLFFYFSIRKTNYRN